MSRWPVPTYPKSSNKPKPKTVVGPSLYKWQMDVVNLYLEHPKNSIITVNSPRQRGKSMLVETVTIMEALNHPGWKIYIVMPTYIAVRKMYKEFVSMLTAIPGMVKASSAQFFDIDLTNGSQISLRSIGSGDALRGNTANLLFIDEGAFINLETAIECVFPYTNATSGDIIITSTPTIKDTDLNLFAKYYFAGLEGLKNTYTVDWADYDTSALMPPEKLELYKKTMPFRIFENEIMGRFLSLNSDLWNLEPVLMSGFGMFDSNMTAGLDFGCGVQNDSTSLVVFNSSDQMVKLTNLNDMKPVDTVHFIINQLKSMPGIKRLVVETNSIGTIYLDMLKREIMNAKLKIQIIPFTTTNDSKREIIENLQLEIANQVIGLVKDNTLLTQFAAFQMKTTPTGKITYENSNDNLHDDIVLATAMARWGAKKRGYILR